MDTSSWKRLEGMEALKNKSDLEIIIWDHHAGGDIKANETHIFSMGAAVSILINEIRKQREIKKKRLLISPIQATLFLMGIYEDTGNLSFPSTRAEDAHAAAFLLEHKADLNILSTFLKQAYSKKQKDVLFQMLRKAERREAKGFSLSIVQMDIYGRVENLATVVRMFREIVNVDVAFGLFKDVDRNKCMVIGRSNVDDINIGILMRSLGGGGHPGAGSALLHAVNPDKVEEMLIELMSGNQYSSVKLSDIMSYPVITVKESTKLEEAAMILREKGCTGVPVVNDTEDLVGIISRRDFKKIRKKTQMQAPVKAFMSRKLKTINHIKSAVEAAKLMIRYDVGRLPVMKDQKLIGIITRSDVMTYFYDLLPD